MKYNDFEKEFEPLGDKAQADGDVYFVCFFSKQQNGYNAFWQEKMDRREAILIIDSLMKSFNLKPKIIAKMYQMPEQAWNRENK